MDNEFIFVFSIIIYLFRTTFFALGFYLEQRRTSRNITNGYFPFVSVIVPARNEESNIFNCIHSIARCNYPKELIEIIAINDRSTDKTGEILDTLRDKIKNLKVIHIIKENKTSNLKGKVAALNVGIENSSGEIILMTDADCTVPPNWITAMVSHYQNQNVGFISSFTNVVGTRVFDKLQAIEWIYTHTMAMGGVGLNQPLGCYGNNISVRRKSFEKIGGYKKIKFSVTEDLALQQAIHAHGNKIHYIISNDTLIDTMPCQTFLEYLRQHHRWSRGGLALGWRAAIFILSSLAIWAGLFVFTIHFNLPILLTILSIRFLGDLLIILPSIIILNKKRYLLYFPLAIFLFLFMELLVPLIVLYPTVRWKGQTFNTSLS